MTGIVDYGAGNLFSLKSSIAKIGEEAVVTSDAGVLAKADKIILPGVGAFGDAAAKLRASGLDREVIRLAESGRYIMGICLGMQLLFEKSCEYGEHEGLGLIKGTVKDMKPDIPAELKVPHIGWNLLKFKKPSPVFKYVNEGEFVYFVHSFYAAECDGAVTAVTEYGAEITAAVEAGNVLGCQFHPEKSGRTGLAILKAFCEL